MPASRARDFYPKKPKTGDKAASPMIKLGARHDHPTQETKPEGLGGPWGICAGSLGGGGLARGGAARAGAGAGPAPRRAYRAGCGARAALGRSRRWSGPGGGVRGLDGRGVGRAGDAGAFGVQAPGHPVLDGGGPGVVVLAVDDQDGQRSARGVDRGGRVRAASSSVRSGQVSRYRAIAIRPIGQVWRARSRRNVDDPLIGASAWPAAPALRARSGRPSAEPRSSSRPAGSRYSSSRAARGPLPPMCPGLSRST